MKLLKLLSLVLIITLTSCSTVKVVSDYDTKVDFGKYKTFAFYKKGIDKAAVSDLDKKRIMRAVEVELLAKGFTKSQNPDILVSIFTKSRERINVRNRSYGFGYGFGYGLGAWRPWYYGGVSNNIDV
ncbi:MAG: DUF4136 domain-containing protein, partial [Flavobacteriaceae bacterium]|nr:DUF4136 domain-containing protein [Flavobacteriaceae bacterium]